MRIIGFWRARCFYSHVRLDAVTSDSDNRKKSDTEFDFKNTRQLEEQKRTQPQLNK